MSKPEEPKFSDGQFGEETLLIIAEAVAEQWDGHDYCVLAEDIWNAQHFYMRLLVESAVKDLLPHNGDEPATGVSGPPPVLGS